MTHSYKLLILLLLLAGSLSPCYAQKRYARDDYSFYNPNFKADSTSLLRTDGVYVLRKIETSGTGGKTEIPATKAAYKFYPTGQVNKILDTVRDVKPGEDIAAAFNRTITDKALMNRPTLFEGYYRLEGDRMVIQNVVSATRQFFYTYALVGKDQIIIVKTTHVGKGKIKDKYYTDYYREYYQFVPGMENYLAPNW